MKRTVDVNIPLGPIHPCFKEPARLKCEAKGERIVSAEVELGYMKKGIERIMKGRPWQEVMFLAEPRLRPGAKKHPLDVLRLTAPPPSFPPATIEFVTGTKPG